MKTTKTIRLSDGKQYILTINVNEDTTATLTILQVGDNGKLGNFSTYNNPPLQLVNEPKYKLFSTEEEAKDFLDKITDGDSPSVLS